MLVRENIEFKRSRDSKSSLGVGIVFSLKNNPAKYMKSELGKEFGHFSVDPNNPFISFRLEGASGSNRGILQFNFSVDKEKKGWTTFKAKLKKWFKEYTNFKLDNHMGIWGQNDKEVIYHIFATQEGLDNEYFVKNGSIDWSNTENYEMKK